MKVEDFTKSFHDGLALAALIHKHRPQMINFENLNKVIKKFLIFLGKQESQP